MLYMSRFVSHICLRCLYILILHVHDVSVALLYLTLIIVSTMPFGVLCDKGWLFIINIPVWSWKSSTQTEGLDRPLAMIRP